MVLITRRAEFSASHICANPALSPEENLRRFGPEAHPNGHGHNYVLEVTVEGKIDPVDGMIMDLKELKEIINREVVEVYDHRHFNREIPPFDKVIPTVENVAKDAWERLQPHVDREGQRLHGIRLYETPDLYVDYAGEGI